MAGGPRRRWAAAVNEYARALERRRLYSRVNRLLDESMRRAASLKGGDEIQRMYGSEATRQLRRIVSLGGRPRTEHLVVMLRETIWKELGK